MAKLTLQYQRKPAGVLRNHRRGVRLALIVIALLVVARVANRIPEVLENLRTIPLQRRCLNYISNPQQQVATFPGPGATPLSQWAEFYSEVFGQSLSSAGTVFLHERTAANGQRRLVAVDCVAFAMNGTGEQYTRLETCVIVPGTAFSPPRAASVLRPGSLSLGKMRELNPTTIYFGEPDPADDSHFTIRIRHGETTTVVDGWLQNDGTVRLTKRSI